VFDFDLDETVTVLDGIRRKVGDRVRVESAAGVPVVQRVFPSMFDMFGGNRREDPEGFDADAEFRRAVGIAGAADVAVVVAGEWQNMIGEAASRSSLELPGRQLELLQAVVGTGTPTVLLVMNGRPLDLRWAAENVPAILDIWYPGTQGGAAVANLLFGEVSPSGKLPFSWPRTVGQVPFIYSHTRSHEPRNQGRRYWDEPSTPLFPFGHGLSYGRFSYSDLIVDRPSIPRREPSPCRCRSPTPPTETPPRSSSSTSTNATAPPRGRCASSKASNASPCHPRRPSRCSSSSVPSTGGTGAQPNGTGSSTPLSSTSGWAAAQPPS
jgi:beta-glucosidase